MLFKYGCLVSVVSEPWKDDLASIYHNSIQIKKRKNEEIMLHILIHECGHIAICNKRNYDVTHKAVMGKKYGTLVYKLGVLEEEIEAWNVGLKMAQKLGFEINMKKFNEYRARKLSTYMSWVVSRKTKSWIIPLQQHSTPVKQ